MQEPHVEDVANHNDPESCGAHREVHVEALTKDAPIKDIHLFPPDKKAPIPPIKDTTNKGHPLIFPGQKAPLRDSGIRSKRRRVMCGDWSEVRLGQQVGILYC